MKEIRSIARVKFLLGKLEEWKRLTAEAVHYEPWLSMDEVEEEAVTE